MLHLIAELFNLFLYILNLNLVVFLNYNFHEILNNGVFYFNFKSMKLLDLTFFPPKPRFRDFGKNFLDRLFLYACNYFCRQRKFPSLYLYSIFAFILLKMWISRRLLAGSQPSQLSIEIAPSRSRFCAILFFWKRGATILTTFSAEKLWVVVWASSIDSIAITTTLVISLICYLYKLDIMLINLMNYLGLISNATWCHDVVIIIF